MILRLRFRNSWVRMDPSRRYRRDRFGLLGARRLEGIGRSVIGLEAGGDVFGESGFGGVRYIIAIEEFVPIADLLRRASACRWCANLPVITPK